MPYAYTPECAGCRATPHGFVLVVDDDEDARAILEARLTLAGYHVAAVANGREALEWLQAGRRPCLILLDLAMPVLDGWQFMAARARDPALAGIPVVLVSGSVDQRAAALDAVAVLEKPFDLDRLLEVVRCRCRLARAAAGSRPLHGAP